MIGRIVEISTDQRHLSTYRGFMVVHDTAQHNVGGNATAIERLATMVRSADPDNCEAQGTSLLASILGVQL